MNKKQPIILLSNEPWGEVWFSKQHYANELARMGHEVYFVNPTHRWGLTSLFKWRLKKEHIKENLSTISYNNLIPGGFALSRWMNDIVLCIRLRLFLKSKEPLFWNFDPFRLSSIYFFRNSQYVYHVVDQYRFKSDLNNAKSADLIVLVSNEHADRYSSLKKRMIEVPHGLSKDETVTDIDRVQEIENRLGKYILYVGTFHEGLDFELLDKISMEFDSSLVLVGPKARDLKSEAYERLEGRSNVHFVGQVDSSEIKFYIAASQICLIPYMKEHNHRNPLKALHYLAQGKPIVSIPLSGWSFLEDEMFFFGNSHEEQLDRIRELKSKEVKRVSEKLSQYISSIRYDVLINRILKELEE